MVEKAREDLASIDAARKKLAVGPQSPAALRQLCSAGSLASTFLDQLIAVLEDGSADNAPLAVKDALRYYSTFQTSRSAENSALLVWSFLLQSQKGQPLCAPSVLPRQEL